MKRPVGLILSAIILSLAALLLLLMTAVMVFVTAFWKGGNPSASTMPHFFAYLGILVGVIYLGAAWPFLRSSASYAFVRGAATR